MSRTAAAREREDVDTPRETATVEPDFRVGAADDRYEQAADRTADQVLRRLAEQGGLGSEGGSSGDGGGSTGMGREGGVVDAETSSRIRASSGAPLPGAVRRSMEGAFGADLGSVRLHTGPSAAALSSQLGARAFTVGNDVFLGQGSPSLSSRQGQHLLAHELAHTQQDGGGAHRSIHRKYGKGATLDGWAAGDLPQTARTTTTPSTNAAGVTTTTSTTTSDRTDDQAVSTGEQLGEVGALAAESASTMNQVEVTNGYIKDLNDADGGKREQIGSGTEQTNVATGGAAVAGFAFLVEGGMALHKWRSGFKDSDEAFSAAMGSLSAAAGAGSAITNAVKEHEGGDGEKVTSVKDGKESTEVVGAASETTKEAASIFAEIAGILGSIKAAYEAVKAIVKAIQTARGLESGDVSGAALAAVTKSVQAGKAAMETVNSFMNHLGTVTAPMINAVPGLGIAIGVLEVLANGYALGISYMGWAAMRDDKRAAKVILIGARDLTKNKTMFGNISAVEVAEQILADTTSLPAKVAAAKDYQLSRELQVIGGKRIRRNLLNIATTVPGIAGDIAMLSGAGAGVGVGLKAAGSGAKGLASLIRFGKQKWNDWRDNDKSTRAKRAGYDSMITRLTANVLAANALPTGPAGAVSPLAAFRKQKQETAMGQVLASGMTVSQLTRLKGDGKTLWTTWITALRNRDGLS